KIADGTTNVAVAVDEDRSHSPGLVTTSAQASDRGFRISGGKSFVADGHVADLILVSARSSGGVRDENGISLFLVPRDCAGLTIERQMMVDSRNSATVQFDGVEVDFDALVGETAGDGTRKNFREKLRAGELNDREIEVDVVDNSNPMGGMMDIPGMPGTSMSMINMNDLFGKAFGDRTKKKKMRVDESYDILMRDEADKLLDEEKVVEDAIHLVEQNGIVFLDELDKIAARQDVRGGDVSREGVQRDLLPMIEGTTVTTKHGPVKTDHILFIASGAFHYAKPSDLLAELQGRLPIRVELRALTVEDFKKILKETEASLIKQYTALIGTEKVELIFEDDAIDEISKLSFEVNEQVENIGARRLHTVMEKLLEEISFSASDRGGETVTITADYVKEHVEELVKSADLSKFIL
ncbi:MAG: ATP-dependent protease ATPase subunit HslU, partial [Alphaproteobacteria bacterium]|nr:ATP-dependent protease ATPase subunit HslU [Alphaproteobacteria bacterium]